MEGMEIYQAVTSHGASLESQSDLSDLPAMKAQSAPPHQTPSAPTPLFPGVCPGGAAGSLVGGL